MNAVERVPEIMTPEQAAAYLQVNRETIYRYIRQGKLTAAKLGRSYRIPRRSVELFLWSSRTRDDIPLRDYTPEEVRTFVADDELDDAMRAVMHGFTDTDEASANQPS